MRVERRMLTYFLSSEARGRTLPIVIEQTGRSSQLFPLKPNLGWTYFETQIDKYRDTSIILRGIVGPADAVAVDDIEFYTGTCDSQNRRIIYHCNFENQVNCRLGNTTSYSHDADTVVWKQTAIGSDDHTRLLRGDGHAMQLKVSRPNSGYRSFVTLLQSTRNIVRIILVQNSNHPAFGGQIDN